MRIVSKRLQTPTPFSPDEIEVLKNIQFRHLVMEIPTSKVLTQRFFGQSDLQSPYKLAVEI